MNASRKRQSECLKIIFSVNFNSIERHFTTFFCLFLFLAGRCAADVSPGRSTFLFIGSFLLSCITYLLYFIFPFCKGEGNCKKPLVFIADRGCLLCRYHYYTFSLPGRDEVAGTNLCHSDQFYVFAGNAYVVY